jgi:hypothetical protein
VGVLEERGAHALLEPERVRVVRVDVVYDEVVGSSALSLLGMGGHRGDRC